MILALLLALTPQQLINAGKAADAVPLLEKQLRDKPRNARAANDLGYAYDRLGQQQRAEEYYRLAIKNDPARWLAYGNLVSMLADAPDRWDRADEILALMGQGLARAPTFSARIWLAIRVANFERSVGRLAAARQRLSELSELKPSAAQQQQIRELLDRIAVEEKARAIEDWPEPLPSSQQLVALQGGEQQLLGGDARAALAVGDTLTAALPAWRAAHWLRARALEALGRIDEAARELRIVTQLAPSHALAWRKLGEILAEHGGLLEAEAADEALRQALALEPSWTQLWLLRARVALRQGRAQDALRCLDRLDKAGGATDESRRLAVSARAEAGQEKQNAPAPAPLKEPTAQARALLQQARDLSPVDAPDATRALLLQALAESPAFIDAAAALVATGGAVPDATVQALWNDGNALLELAAQVRRAGGTPAVVTPWLERAVELGAPEARWARAQLRYELLDRDGALADLVAYAAQPQPLHLDEARALRARLVPPARVDASQLEARLRLAEERPEAAIAALGSRCAADVPEARLVALGRAHEYAGEARAAFACYRLAVRAAPSDREALRRLSHLATRLVEPAAAPELEKAAAAGIPAAQWALARIDLGRGRNEDAVAHITQFLATAGDEDGVAEARAAKDRLERTSSDKAAQRARRAALALSSVAVLIALVLWFWGGSTVERALRLQPQLFPAVAKAASELRHDVVKHRASVLGMLAEPGTRREDVARALLSPEPASQVVARQYASLRAAARAHGISLRSLGRDPVFGPFARDLARAEKLLGDPGTQYGSPAVAGGDASADPYCVPGSPELAEIDRRIREVHTPRLAGLLRLGPRTRLDAGSVESWIRDVEAEMRRGGERWTPPSILLQGLDLDFPVEQQALSTIFANLLRNAQAAAGSDGRVIVRVGEERDAAGRKLLTVLVGDSAPNTVSLEAIEQRESGRGLAIVRDLTREWQGHLVVRPEEAPWTKAVGACFPAPPAA